MFKMKTIKTSLKSLTNKNNIDKINDAVYRMNNLTFDVYNFIKMYTLYTYENCKTIPNINLDFVICCFKVVSVNSNKSGRVPTKNKQLLENLSLFYRKEFEPIQSTKTDMANLSHIIRYVATNIITNIKNNIWMNFDKYIKNLISMFSKRMGKIIDKKMINKITNHIIFSKKLGKLPNMKITGKLTLKNFANKSKNLKENIILLLFDDYINSMYLPERNGKCVMADVKNNPLKYLSFAIQINREIEKYNNSLKENEQELKHKLYQNFPIQSNMVPKYIPIDTTIILDLLVDNGISQYYNKKTSNDIYGIWDFSFAGLHKQKNKKLLKNGEYRFNNLIYTDGYSVSVIQISNIKVSDHKNRNEFPYIEELNDDELNKLNEMTCIGVDPGKRNIVTIINENKQSVKYSSQQRKVECLHKTKKKIIDSLKGKTLIEQESELNKTNSKSSVYETFRNYVSIKNKVNENGLKEFYKIEVFRKYKWKTYIQTQKSESLFVNKIKEAYSDNNKDICLFYGNWSQPKQMANYYPTPGIRMKRMLSKHFKIVTIDEYKTSKLCVNCEHETENILYRRNPKPYKSNYIAVHSLLCCKNINCNKLYDRDINGSSNILKLGLHYLHHKCRKNNFKRKE